MLGKMADETVDCIVLVLMSPPSQTGSHIFFDAYFCAYASRLSGFQAWMVSPLLLLILSNSINSELCCSHVVRSVRRANWQRR